LRFAGPVRQRPRRAVDLIELAVGILEHHGKDMLAGGRTELECHAVCIHVNIGIGEQRRGIAVLEYLDGEHALNRQAHYRSGQW